VELWQAVVLGIVEGVTEFLPVSSTGHLLMVQRLIGIPESAAAHAYVIAIQGGAIAAVFVLYRRRLVQILRGVLGRDPAGPRLALAVATAFMPAALVGLLLGDVIERVLFGPVPIAVAWAFGGAVILAVSSRIRPEGAPLESLSLRAALAIGAFQCLALWPGVSRSLATILGALLIGLSLSAAVEFSFVLGLVTLGAASAYKALDGGPAMMQAYGPVEIAAGFVAAWVAAMLSVAWMVRWLQTRSLAVFGWWRLAAAALVVVLFV
jgi:undecaprenyl-diphosphatase